MGSCARDVVLSGYQPYTHYGFVLYETGPNSVGASRRLPREQKLLGLRSHLDNGHFKQYPLLYVTVEPSLHPEELRPYQGGELAVRSEMWTSTGVLGGPPQSHGSPLPDHILGELHVPDASWAGTQCNCQP